METSNKKRYLFEFLSIFIAVISAFALNNWNEDRRNNVAEAKILQEIKHGLEKDLEDVKLNVLGHKQGVLACDFWRKIFTNQATNTDTFLQYYFVLTRDFVSIQNTSGYETLKSKGLELIKNDSLRSKIISLYEYDYATLLKLEEEYNELQFQENYFKEINKYIAPNLRYDTLGNINGIKLPISVSKKEQNILLSYLWKIKRNRTFILSFYASVEKKINELHNNIENAS